MFQPSIDVVAWPGLGPTGVWVVRPAVPCQTTYFLAVVWWIHWFVLSAYGTMFIVSSFQGPVLDRCRLSVICCLCGIARSRRQLTTTNNLYESSTKVVERARVRAPPVNYVNESDHGDAKCSAAPQMSFPAL